MQSPVSHGGPEIKKVAWRLVFFLLGGGVKGHFLGEGRGWQLLVIHKVQLLKFIWALCSLGIFLICLYVS